MNNMAVIRICADMRYDCQCLGLHKAKRALMAECCGDKELLNLFVMAIHANEAKEFMREIDRVSSNITKGIK